MNRAENSQQAVIDFLGRPATYGGAPVKRIDTHAAAVFLAGDRALKIKRAVRFPFLDYSTLEKRRAACAAEIEVNQPFAPAIYRGVVAITREPGGALAIGGDGEPVEWAVEMRRFDETQTLDHLAEQGRIDGALADALGRAVARAHAAAPVDTVAGFADALNEVIAQNDEELRASPDLFPTARVDALMQTTRAAFARVQPLLVARERAGLVRRCHGDLHLGNIVLLDGAPVLFDAIEFDPKFATGDVFYDLAFLLMDLIERDLRPAANIVLNRYLAETRRADDLDALAALPLFLSLRAAIRAKVAAERRAQGADVAQSARAYFALAAPAAGAAGAAPHRHRRPFRHRQVAAGAWLGRRHAARAGRGGAAQRYRAQGAVRHRRDRALCRTPATRPTSPRRSTPASPTRHGASSPPATRRSWTRCSRKPANGRRSRKPRPALRSTGCFSPPISASGSPASAGAKATPRMPMRWSPTARSNTISAR